MGLWSLIACESQDDLQVEVEMLIEQRVQNRKDSYTSTMSGNCERKVLEEANRIVDSIVIAEARLKKDTIPKPPRPDRPPMPEPRELKDTMPVEPLFPDSLAIDSIGGK